jgi:multidrug efflux pump subunit AcrB
MKKRTLNFIESAMKYKQVTLVVTTLLVLLGVNALLTMPRSEDPKIDMPVGMVMAFYPGTDEVQMEKQVTNKIEQYLFSFEEVRKDKTKSETKDGQVFITVELHTEVKDRKKFWSSLQHGLNMNMAAVLPKGVIGPIVNSNFGDVVAQMITVSSPIRSYAEIEKYLDKLEDGLKTIPTVSKINRSGGQKQQIYVTVDDLKMRQYGFDVSAIIGALQTQNVTGYTGELTVANNNVPVFAGTRFNTEADVANQIVYTHPNGTVVRLKDIANIERRYEETSSYIRVGDDKVMMLTVEMQPGNNIVKFGKEVETKMGQLQSTFPDDVKVEAIVNQPEVVDKSISHFMVEFGIAIATVLVVIMLLMPFRIAAIASMAAPISIAITFGIINLMGIELHQVTLVALIIVMGMVVDNAIVVVDNYIEKLDEGITPWTAAWQAATQLSLPIFTATLAIIFAFAPLAFFMNGIAKDFIAALPVTVAVALAASMAVALLVTPYTCYLFIKNGLKHKVSERPPKLTILDRLQNGFNKVVELCFRRPKSTVALAVLSVIMALVVAGNVDEEFFPTAERNQFNMEVWLPSGTSLPVTEEAVKKLEKILKEDQRVVSVASFVGGSSPRFHITYAPEVPRRNFAQIFITTIDEDATNQMAKEYLKKLDGFLPDGEIKIRQLSMQATSPIEVRVIGDNLNDQKRVAAQVEEILRNEEGANFIRNDYDSDNFGVTVKIKDDVASRLGVSKQAITQTLGAQLKGFSVSTLWEGDKPVDIFLRLDANSRKDFNDLSDLYISTQFGGKVPLKEVAELVPGWHTGKIAHRNGLRTLTITSEAQNGIRASKVQARIEPKIAALNLPEGIRIQYGGELENSGENAPGMAASLGVSLILIFLTLLFQFKNFKKTLIILATFPLSLLGAFLGLYLTGNPMGMTAFMGIISLIGIVVRNGIILVDYADELVRDHGYTIKAAALAAAKRRMRPIFLTSSAAAVGVIPMIIGKSPMWGPLASVLAFGLMVSMVLTLFVVPVLYYLFVKPEPEEEELIQPDADDHIQYRPSHA